MFHDQRSPLQMQDEPKTLQHRGLSRIEQSQAPFATAPCPRPAKSRDKVRDRSTRAAPRPVSMQFTGDFGQARRVPYVTIGREGVVARALQPGQPFLGQRRVPLQDCQAGPCFAESVGAGKTDERPPPVSHDH